MKSSKLRRRRRKRTGRRKLERSVLPGVDVPSKVFRAALDHSIILLEFHSGDVSRDELAVLQERCGYVLMEEEKVMDNSKRFEENPPDVSLCM